MVSPIIFSPNPYRVSALDVRRNGRCEQMYTYGGKHAPSMRYKKCTEFQWRQLISNNGKYDFISVTPPEIETKLYQIGEVERRVLRSEDGISFQSSKRLCNDRTELYLQEKKVQWYKCTGKGMYGNRIWKPIEKLSEKEERHLRRSGRSHCYPNIQSSSEQSQKLRQILGDINKIENMEVRYERQRAFFDDFYKDFYGKNKAFILVALSHNLIPKEAEHCKDVEPLEMLRLACKSNVVSRQMKELETNYNQFYESYKSTIQKILLLDHPPFQKKDFIQESHEAIDALEKMRQENWRDFSDNFEWDCDYRLAELRAMRHIYNIQGHYSKFYNQNRMFVNDLLKGRSLISDHTLVEPDPGALEYLQNAYREIVVLSQMEELARDHRKFYKKNKSYIRNVLLFKKQLALLSHSDDIEPLKKLEAMYQKNYNDLAIMQEYFCKLEPSVSDEKGSVIRKNLSNSLTNGDSSV